MASTPRSPCPVERPERYRAANRAAWDRTAGWYETHNRRDLERYGGEAWGMFRVPERELQLLGPVRGRDILELGCGAAWWSIALARRGARAVGLDFSPTRLSQARAKVRAAGLDVPLIAAPAERTPFPDASFDLVLSDYGATTFADPFRTVPEVARVLRPGGVFAFAHAGPLRSVAETLARRGMSRRLVRDYFGLHALRTADTVEFQLTYSDWFRLFQENGLGVERLIEPVAPRNPLSTYLSKRDQEWARHWPIECLWSLRKTSAPGRGSGVDRRRPGRRK